MPGSAGKEGKREMGKDQIPFLALKRVVIYLLRRI